MLPAHVSASGASLQVFVCDSWKRISVSGEVLLSRRALNSFTLPSTVSVDELIPGLGDSPEIIPEFSAAAGWFQVRTGADNVRW